MCHCGSLWVHLIWNSLGFLNLYVCFLPQIEFSAIISFLFFKNLFIVFIYFLAVLGRRCCVRAFSSCIEWGLLFVAVLGLLIEVASLVVEHGL